MPSYILKKQHVFLDKNENNPVFKKRSAGRIKTHCSYTDLRAWSLECEENRQYFLDIMSHAGLPSEPSPCDAEICCDDDAPRPEDETPCCEDRATSCPHQATSCPDETNPCADEINPCADEINPCEEEVTCCETEVVCCETEIRCPDQAQVPEVLDTAASCVAEMTEMRPPELRRMLPEVRGMSPEVRRAPPEVGRTSRCLQCRLDAEGETHVLDEAFQILEHANDLLTESLHSECCIARDTPPKDKQCCLQSSQLETSRSRLLHVLDNLHKQNECLKRITNLETSSSCKHVKGQLDCLRFKVEKIREKIKESEEKCKKYSDIPDDRLHGCIKEIRKENCRLQDFIDFSNKLSERLTCVQSEYLQLAKDRSTLRSATEECETHPATSQCESSLERIRNNWLMAKRKVKDFGDFGKNTDSSTASEKTRMSCGRNRQNNRSSRREREKLKSEMEMLTPRVQSQHLKALDRITLLEKIISHDKKEIERIKELLREERRQCKSLQLQIQEHLTNKLNQAESHRRPNLKKMKGRTCENERSTQNSKSHMTIKTIHPKLDGEYCWKSNSPSYFGLADDLSLSTLRQNCHERSTREESETKTSVDPCQRTRREMCWFCKIIVNSRKLFYELGTEETD